MTEQAKKKRREVVSFPIYVVVEEDAMVLPSVGLEIVTPSELPTEGNFYALTRDGLKISKDTGIFKAVVPANSAKFLADVEFVPKLKLPKIPPMIIARAWRFFQAVFDEYRTESELMLMYNRHLKMYDLWCPQQTVSYAGVDYNMSTELQASQERQYGDNWNPDQTASEWEVVGTIHSHADFSPYHSGVDHHDERGMDGVHITIGYVDDEEYCSLCASVMIQGKRWSLPPENIAVGLERTTAKRGRKGYYISTSANQDYFDVVLSEEEEAEMESAMQQIQEEWMPRVTKETNQYQRSNYSSSYEYDSTSFIEEEENGEWCLIDGKWQFLEDVEDGEQQELPFGEAQETQIPVADEDDEGDWICECNAQNDIGTGGYCWNCKKSREEGDRDRLIGADAELESEDESEPEG
jgi:hypothetical protein